MSCINLENTQRMIQNFKMPERKVRLPLFQVKALMSVRGGALHVKHAMSTTKTCVMCE